MADDLARLATLLLGSSRGHGGCWLWEGAVNSGGYAQTTGPRSEHGHRLTFRLFRGEIPDGANLHHICREKRCLNPDHLELMRKSDHSRLHNAEKVCRKCGGPLVKMERQRYGDGWRDVRRCPVCRREQQRAAVLRNRLKNL